jgi:hypothetical protein
MLAPSGICGGHLPLQRLQIKVHRTIGNFPRRTPVRDLRRLSTFRLYTIIKQNYVGNKQKPLKNMRMNMFAAQDKRKPDIEIIKGLN